MYVEEANIHACSWRVFSDFGTVIWSLTACVCSQENVENVNSDDRRISTNVRLVAEIDISFLQLRQIDGTMLQEMSSLVISAICDI